MERKEEEKRDGEERKRGRRKTTTTKKQTKTTQQLSRFPKKNGFETATCVHCVFLNKGGSKCEVQK